MLCFVQNSGMPLFILFKTSGTVAFVIPYELPEDGRV
jgi:hypothetical protein